MECSPVLGLPGELKLNSGTSQCWVVLWNAIATGDWGGSYRACLGKGRVSNCVLKWCVFVEPRALH